MAKYVASDITNIDYAQQIQKSGVRYNGYNLVLTEIRYSSYTVLVFVNNFLFITIVVFWSDDIVTTVHCSNISTECKLWPERISLGFGNSPPDTPLEKVKAGRQQFDDILKQKTSKEILVHDLMQLLKDKKKFVQF